MTDEILLAIWNSIKQDLPEPDGIRFVRRNDNVARMIRTQYFTLQMSCGTISVSIAAGDRPYISLERMVSWYNNPTHHIELSDPEAIDKAHQIIKGWYDDDFNA